MYYDYYLYYLSYFSSVYYGYPLIIRVTAVMVTILIILTIIGLVRLLVLGYFINRREKRWKIIQNHFEEKLHFVMSNKVTYDVDEIRALVEYDVNKTKKWKLDILTDIVLSVKNSIYKEGKLNDINYRNCLEALRLMGYWEKQVRSSSNLDGKRKAIQVIGQIDNGVNTGILSKSTFHKNKHLRKTARDLYTGQDEYNPFKFMEDNFDEAFTQLDKLRLHSTLVKRAKESKLPNLLKWVNNSKNPKYLVFLLKEISFFNQQETGPMLLNMFEKQENREVKAQIVLTLGDLQYYEAIPMFKNRFHVEPNIVRDAIIFAMGKMRRVEILDFLIEAYEDTDDSELQILIARSIKKFDKDGERVLKQLRSDADVHEKVKEGILLEQVISEKTMLSV